MYEVKVKDNLFIAHSLNDEFFGPAKNLHGATYVIDLIISSKELSDKNVVIDIAYQLTNDFIEKLKDESSNTSKIYSVKMILNESHVASASYEKKI